MRISRHQMFMEIAHVVAKRSTCFRENVGAIIVKDNKIISLGYNGRPRGEPHCQYHPKGRCTKAIHAEVNAMDYIINGHYPLIKCYDLYVTHLPCENCTQTIIKNTFIRSVYFQTLYGDSEPTYKALDGALIKLLRVMPSGDITSHDRAERYDELK